MYACAIAALSLLGAMQVGCGGRTAISDVESRMPTCSISDGFVTVGQRVTLHANTAPIPEHTFWTISQSPPASSATVTDREGTIAAFTPDTEGHYEFFFVAMHDGRAGMCTVGLETGPAPHPPRLVCPDDVTATALDEVELTASVTDDGTVVSLEWSLSLC